MRIPPIDRRGSASFAFFVVLFMAATIVFFMTCLGRPKSGEVAGDPPPASPRVERLNKLQEEMGGLFTSLDGAEAMRSSSRYLEVIAAAEPKLIEADDLWEEEMKTQRGLVDGFMGGLSENYDVRFTNADKYRMLSEKYGLPVEKIRTLKADIEIMFMAEFADKFALPEEPPKKDTEV